MSESWLTNLRDQKYDDGMVFIESLPKGTVFDGGKYNNQAFVKIYDCPGSTYVRSLTRRHNSIEKEDGSQVDFDTPGGYLHISRLSRVRPIEGAPVLDGGKTKRRGGKDPQEPIKPANPLTKRGAILAYMMKNLDSETSAAQACEDLKCGRSLLLTHLFEIWRDHGVGYSVNGDSIAVELPPEIKDPFKPKGEQ